MVQHLRRQGVEREHIVNWAFLSIDVGINYSIAGQQKVLNFVLVENNVDPDIFQVCVDQICDLGCIFRFH